MWVPIIVAFLSFLHFFTLIFTLDGRQWHSQHKNGPKAVESTTESGVGTGKDGMDRQNSMADLGSSNWTCKIGGSEQPTTTTQTGPGQNSSSALPFISIHPVMNWTFITKFICCSSHSRCDGIWRWSFCETIGFNEVMWVGLPWWH